MVSHTRFAILFFFLGILFSIPASVFAQNKVEIEVWLRDDELSQCVSDTITSGFNAQSETVEARVVLQPNVGDTINTALQGGGGPDIVPLDGPAFAQRYADAGLLLPLDPFIEQFGWDEYFIPWALELGRVNGELYSLPDSLETMVIWYNKTLFDANGWEVPITTAELVSLSQTIADAGVIPFGNGYGECLECMGALGGSFLNHYAGPEMMYQALTGQVDWTDPVFVEAITIINDMVQNGWIDGGTDRMFTDSFATGFAMVGTGEAAMTLDGSWANMSDYFGEAAGNDNDFDWFPIPTRDGEEMYFTGVGATWSINAATEHPQESAEFLDWMYSPEAQSERFLSCNFALAPVNISEDVLSQADPRTARIYTSYADAASDGRYGYATWTFFPNSMGIAVNDNIQKVFLGTMTPEEYMQELQDLFEEAVAEGTVPPLPAR